MAQREAVRYAAERMLWRCVFVALGAAFCIVAAPVVWNLFSPFIIGLAVAALLQPLIRVMQERLHVRRGVAAAFWIALAAAAACLLLYWIASFVVVQLAVASPGVAASVTELLRTATNRLLDMAQTLPDTLGGPIRSSLNSAYQTLTDGAVQFAASMLNGAIGFAASLPYAFVYANFLLLAIIFITNRYESWQRLWSGWLGGGSGHGIRLLKQSAGRGLAGYIRVQLLFAVLTMLISWVFFQAAGFQYAFLIGFAAALLELIPQFGCGVLYIPWCLICFMVGDARNGWLVLGLYLGYSLLRRVTEPELLGSKLGVSPLVSLVGMFVGMRLGGMLGLIVGPIVMVVLVSAARSRLFDGILADTRVIAEYMKARWQRGRQGEGR